MNNKVQYTKNKNLQFRSQVLKIQFIQVKSCEYGEGIFALQDIDKYTIILQENPLYIQGNNINDNIRKYFNQFFTNGLPKTIYNILQFNSFQSDQNVCLYLNASKFNHQCLSNCRVYFKNNLITIQTKEYIKQGQQLFISYIKNDITEFVNYNYRLNQLKLYGFKCQCQLCQIQQIISTNQYQNLILNSKLNTLSHEQSQQLELYQYVLNKALQY